MRRLRWYWLLLALLLFGAAALLMAGGDEDQGKKTARKVYFPRSLRHPEWERMERRQTLPPRPPPAQPADRYVPEPPRDPVLLALPSTPGGTAVVLEANALVNSPVGQMLLQCLRDANGAEGLEELKRRGGIDVLQDLDRFAFSDKVAIASGHFQGAKWDELFKDMQAESYGEKGRVWALPDSQGTTMGVWGDQMVLFGDSPDEVKAAVDRIEGRAGNTEPAISEQATYGEAYGVLGANALDDLFKDGSEDLVKRLKALTDRVELHVDARGDVAMVARVDGKDADQMSDLAKSLGGALSLARLKAKADGDQDLVDLLDLARVTPNSSGSFSMELALPLPLIEKKLAFCKEVRALREQPPHPAPVEPKPEVPNDEARPPTP